MARASLQELLEDYRDFLRIRAAPLWEKHSKEARYTRRLGARRDTDFEDFRPFIETPPPR